MSVTVGVIGAGRAGVGLALALARAGVPVRIHGRGARSLPDELPYTTGETPPWLREMDAVVIAVPDDAIGVAAASLAATAAIGPQHVVLHLSGAHGREVLAPLAGSGAALGSLHPLQSLSDPMMAPTRLRGAVATVEGDDRAVRLAATLARRVGLEPVTIDTAKKPGYHAAAVFASNFLVTLAHAAQKLFVQAGLPEDAARRALVALMTGTLENVKDSGPEAALTGPVARGDAETVRRHLDALGPAEAELYRTLSRATLDLSRLDPRRRAAILRMLD